LDSNIKKILLGIVFGVIGFGVSSMFFEPTHAKLLGVIVFLETLWTNDGVPLGVHFYPTLQQRCF
jgi:sodium-dependent dicarboxylate transporter 2/3/5